MWPFKRNKKEITAPVLTVENTVPLLDHDTDALLTEAILSRDSDTFLKEYEARQLTPETLLENGETLISYAFNVEIENYIVYGQACRHFQENDNNFHGHIEKIQELIENIPDDEKDALIKLSSDDFLTRLSIPQDQWPDWHIGAELNRSWIEFASSVEAIYACLQQARMISKKLNDDSNGIHISPVALENLRTKHGLAEQDIYVNRTENVARTYLTFNDSLQKSLSAKDFIACARNPSFKENFTWLASYQPSEEEFLNIFDPEWQSKIRSEYKTDTDGNASDTDSNTSDDDNDSGDADVDMCIEKSFKENIPDKEYNHESSAAEEEKRKKERAMQERRRMYMILYLHDLHYYEWITPSEQTKRVIEKNYQPEKSMAERFFENLGFNKLRNEGRNKGIDPDRDERRRDRGLDLDFDR